MWRWVVRGILVVVLAALILRRYHREPSVGLPVNIVTNECGPRTDETIVNRMVVLVVGRNGQTTIDYETVPSRNLANHLWGIYKTRNERILFLDGTDSASFQDVASAIDIAETAVPGLKVLVITPSVRNDCENPIWHYVPRPPVR
jgi:biopolymer transport protein ExbD